MRALRVHELGRYDEVLRLEDVDPPGEPAEDEVVLDVAACGLNFPDLLLTAGQYQERPPLPFTPGLEVVGRVAAVGPGSTVAVGDRVIAATQLPAGGLREQTVVRSADALPVPDSLDDTAAAALHLTYQTAHVALHRRAGLQPGEVLLVHGGAGGVGSAAIQLGKAADAHVIATAGGADKAAVCAELGADRVLDHTRDDVVAAVKDATGGRGADVVFDPVGGETYERSAKAIAFEGRLLVIGFASGEIPRPPLGHALVKNYSIVGVHWGLYRHRDPAVIARTHAELVRLHEQGRIAPRIHAVVPLDDAVSGLRALEERTVIGKVVVAVR